jgi:hypothetical protein
VALPHPKAVNRTPVRIRTAAAMRTGRESNVAPSGLRAFPAKASHFQDTPSRRRDEPAQNSVKTTYTLLDRDLLMFQRVGTSANRR